MGVAYPHRHSLLLGLSVSVARIAWSLGVEGEHVFGGPQRPAVNLRLTYSCTQFHTFRASGSTFTRVVTDKLLLAIRVLDKYRNFYHRKASLSKLYKRLFRTLTIGKRTNSMVNNKGEVVLTTAPTATLNIPWVPKSDCNAAEPKS